jgi:basic membrane lipoprotein Med (substrate-binding protein (PBP1-ABC) superfamily)
MTVGYHADVPKLAPKGWITGSEWDWDKLYTDIVKTTLAGEFAQPVQRQLSSHTRRATTCSCSRSSGR